MSETVLKLEHVNYYRDDSQILSDINLELEAGEHLAIIGPNGAGKSVLAAFISGYQWPSSGSITVFGERFGTVNLFDIRKQMGIISTSRIPEFSPKITVRDIVATGLFGTIVLPLGVEISEPQWRKVDQELQFVDMTKHADKPFRLLSTGQKMRAFIARAILSNPRLLILDEPCSGLDIRARALVIKIMDQMGTRQNRPSIAIISHHLEELPTHVDKVLLLKDGKTLAYGQPSDVITGENFSKGFGCQIEIIKNNGRYLSCVTKL